MESVSLFNPVPVPSSVYQTAYQKCSGTNVRSLCIRCRTWPQDQSRRLIRFYVALDLNVHYLWPTGMEQNRSHKSRGHFFFFNIKWKINVYFLLSPCLLALSDLQRVTDGWAVSHLIALIKTEAIVINLMCAIKKKKNHCINTQLNFIQEGWVGRKLKLYTPAVLIFQLADFVTLFTVSLTCT